MAKRKKKSLYGSLNISRLALFLTLILIILIVILFVSGLYKKLFANLSYAADIPQTSVLTPQADSYVSSSLPSKNFGNSKSLNVSTIPEITYLKFDLSSLSGLNVTGVKLRLRENSAVSTIDQYVQQVLDTSWLERAITYANQPVQDATALKYSGILNSGWVDFEIGDLVKSNLGKTVTLVIKTPSTKIGFYSKETSSKPKLLVDYLVQSTPVPTATPIATSTATNVPSPTSTATPTPGVPQPVGQTGTWSMIFRDEFDGTSVDLTKWRPNWLAGSDTATTPPINDLETSCYMPSQAVVTGGELHLNAVAVTPSSSCLIKNGSQATYASGIVESNGKFNFTYGYYEARMWTPAGVGMWPAFWSDGQNWPQDGEIDVLEAYGTDVSTYHYHYAGCGGNCGPGGSVTIPGATAGWHTYAVNWEPGVITWYYDGAQVWQYTTSITSSPHYMILNLGLKSTSAQVPATLRVDYVRFWRKP